MTTITTTDVTTAAPVATRTRVGWGDLLWLTWRQHRWTILGTAVVVVGAAAVALGIAWHTDATGEKHDLLGRWSYLDVSQMLTLTPMALGAVIAVFWTAPLLSREYEQRTHLVVWSQDLTPIRWLVGKVVLLGAITVVLAAGLGTALIKLMNSMNAVTTDYVPFRPFEGAAFEAAPQVQVGYAVFGFALGLAFSAITRRTVLSMGLALGGFFLVRAFVAGFWRPYFQEPLRKVEPYDESPLYWSAGNDGSWTVNSGYADAAGNEIDFPQVCGGTQSNTEYAKCMADNGVQTFSDYHPADRLVSFQWFEFGVFALLAAGLFALTFVWVRRSRGV
ncbi:ABC transporter permease [Saccharothrix deserti]|uniref:ABC transporter permease n=1 Tax=Saccharothrix deserti TaxID=2593674 RepID=UPI00131AA407|nr:ABC transporter permease subunit [Saccharothrix deserti]